MTFNDFIIPVENIVLRKATIQEGFTTISMAPEEVWENPNKDFSLVFEKYEGKYSWSIFIENFSFAEQCQKSFYPLVLGTGEVQKRYQTRRQALNAVKSLFTSHIDQKVVDKIDFTLKRNTSAAYFILPNPSQYFKGYGIPVIYGKSENWGFNVSAINAHEILFSSSFITKKYQTRRQAMLSLIEFLSVNLYELYDYEFYTKYKELGIIHRENWWSPFIKSEIDLRDIF